VAGAKARARGELYRTKLARTQAQQEREQRRMGQQVVTDDDADLLLLQISQRLSAEDLHQTQVVLK
jgi:hypothetical protein